MPTWGLGIALALLAIPVGAAAQQRELSPWLTATYGYGQRVTVYGVGALWHLPGGAETLAR